MMRRALGQALLVTALMLGAAAALFFVVRGFGEALPVATGSGPSKGAAVSAGHTLFHVLLALATIIVAGRLLGLAFTRIGQPPVIGEVVAGILLGPSCLGAISADAYQFILPPEVAPLLGV